MEENIVPKAMRPKKYSTWMHARVRLIIFGSANYYMQYIVSGIESVHECYCALLLCGCSAAAIALTHSWYCGSTYMSENKFVHQQKTLPLTFHLWIAHFWTRPSHPNRCQRKLIAGIYYTENLCLRLLLVLIAGIAKVSHVTPCKRPCMQNRGTA